MSAGFLAALIASAPHLSRAAVLRPRYGSIPLLLAALCFLWVLLLRYALPGFTRRATAAALGMCVVLLLSWLPRAAGHGWGARYLTPDYYHYVILPTTVVQVAVLAGLLSAPLWVLLGRVAKRWLSRQAAPPQNEPAKTPEPMPISRRTLLATAPWVLPSGAFIAAGYGSFVESRKAVLRRVRVAVPGLPPALAGFRIGQVTDMHIARDLTQLQHLERGLSLLAAERLDILCATGDLCDEPRMFSTVLRLLAQVPVRLGHFGCLGNHEMFVGLDVVRRAYDRSPVQLLEDDSVRLGELRLCGIGYAMRGRSMRLYLPDVPLQLAAALRKRRHDEPTATILLAHHPHVISELGGHDISLVLAGHTHGGQLGLGSGSVIEPVYPYARGLYRDPAKKEQLFVSSGLGHWLPMRLNCPPEVVVIELIPA